MLSGLILFTIWQVKGKTFMSDNIYFDNDCLSSFLWVNQEFILENLFKGKIVVPGEVYSELSLPCVNFLKKKVDTLSTNGSLILDQVIGREPELSLYVELTAFPKNGKKIIGSGEAAAIVLAKTNAGFLASNNMSDVKVYVDEYNIKHLTTGMILKEALRIGLITEVSGNQIWKNMLSRKRKLPTSTFSDYIKYKNRGILY